MIDREKTIRDLKTIGAWHTHHYEPFHYECAETIHNALELLREQEPIKPKRTVDEHGQVFSCGKCGTWFEVQYQKYCHECGKPVKWDE